MTEPKIIMDSDQARICFEAGCFSAELAQTSSEHATGLMNRKNLDMDKGMLFIFAEQGIYEFWMKNTLIPLDIIWIDENNSIVYLYSDARPCNDACVGITPEKKAKYVLEINSGLIKSMGLRTGDKAEIFTDAYT